MTDAQDYSGRELDRAIAEAMGWVFDYQGVRLYARNERQVNDKDGGTLDPLPYSTSLDALADGPEKVLRERGWARLTVEWDNRDAHEVFWYRDRRDEYPAASGFATTEAAARAEAALAALNASRPVPEGGEA